MKKITIIPIVCACIILAACTGAEVNTSSAVTSSSTGVSDSDASSTTSANVEVSSVKSSVMSSEFIQSSSSNLSSKDASSSKKESSSQSSVISSSAASSARSFSSVSSMQTTDLAHPGILHTARDLQTLKANIAAGKQPWLKAFNQMKSSDKASLDYKHKPFAVVECGSYNKPNVGCNEINNDATAAYTHALIFVLTGDQRHANKAKVILNDWASVYQENTNSNARLVVAWAAPFFVNAAELIKAYDESWSQSDIRSFTRMLDKFMGHVKNDARPENNWIWSRIEAHMAIAVFKDDKADLQIAIERWNRYLPTYIYHKATDGNSPIKTPFQDTASTQSKWMAKKFYDGQSMETCRDLGHMDLGFRSMLNAAEIAWVQGVDLFKPNQQRITRFMELHGKWMTGAQTPPADMCRDGYVRAVRAHDYGIKAPEGGGEQSWEIAYKHYGDRLGISLPYTRKMITNARPLGIARWVRKWETLTFAEYDFSGANAINNRPPYVNITMPANGEVFTQGQSIYVLADAIDEDIGDGIAKTTIRVNGVVGRSEVNAPYEWGHDTTPTPDEMRLPVGTHRVEVIAEDMRGAKSTSEVMIEVFAKE